MEIGTTVSAAHRWPFQAAHPDCWGRPWKGTVLALDDPRAWTGSLAFRGTPTQEETSAHVADCKERGLLSNTIPVLWNFGTSEEIQWETEPHLKPYDDVLKEWEAARAERYAELQAA